jgi:hypothetical protein
MLDVVDSHSQQRSASVLLAKAREFARYHPNNRQIADPIHAGWIAWAAFHLPTPSDTMAVFSYSDPFATIQYILSRFAVQALVSRGAGIRPDRFTYLTTFISHVSADRKRTQPPTFDASQMKGNKYSVGKSFVMQVSMVSVEGLSATATVWVEDNTIEIFNPHTHKSLIMTNIVKEYVVGFLREKWMQKDANPTVFEYVVPVVSSPNSLNTYFIFLRSAQSSADSSAAREEVAKAFDDKASIKSLIEKRDLLIQTCGLLIARCAELRDESAGKALYSKYFGPDADVFPLSRGGIEDIPNIFTRCALPQHVLWSGIQNLTPDPQEAASGVARVSAIWPKDVDQKWNNFVESSVTRKMVFKNK